MHPASVLLLISFLQTARSVDSTVSEIRHVFEMQADAWNNGDIAGYMDGYLKSDSLVFTSGGTVNRGWQSTFEKYSKKYNTRGKMGVLMFSDIEIVLLSDNSAWALGKWKLVRASDQPHGMFTLVFRKLPEGWKIVHDHTSRSEE